MYLFSVPFQAHLKKQIFGLSLISLTAFSAIGCNDSESTEAPRDQNPRQEIPLPKNPEQPSPSHPGDSGGAEFGDSDHSNFLAHEIRVLSPDECFAKMNNDPLDQLQNMDDVREAAENGPKLENVRNVEACLNLFIPPGEFDAETEDGEACLVKSLRTAQGIQFTLETSATDTAPAASLKWSLEVRTPAILGLKQFSMRGNDPLRMSVHVVEKGIRQNKEAFSKNWLSLNKSETGELSVTIYDQKIVNGQNVAIASCFFSGTE